MLFGSCFKAAAAAAAEAAEAAAAVALAVAAAAAAAVVVDDEGEGLRGWKRIYTQGVSWGLWSHTSYRSDLFVGADSRTTIVCFECRARTVRTSKVRGRSHLAISTGKSELIGIVVKAHDLMILHWSLFCIS